MVRHFVMPIGRRAAASLLATATLVSGSALTTGTAADAAPTTSSATTATAASTAALTGRARSDRGFRPVDLPRAARGAQPLALFSADPDQMWVAARAADGRLLMLLRSGTSWSVYRTSATVPEGGAVTVDGGARTEVWVAAGRSLLRFDGRRWRDVSTPGTTYLGLTDNPAGTAYVAWRSDADGQRGQLRVGTAARNGALRELSTSRLDAEYDQVAQVTHMDVSGGTLYVALRAQWSKWNVQKVFSLVDGVWAERGALASGGYSGGGRVNALIPTGEGFLALGEDAATSPRDVVRQGLCVTWKPKAGDVYGTSVRCFTGGIVGAAAERRDARVVIGGNDEIEWRGGVRTTVKQGTFRLRERSGAERVIPGDPGEGTLAVAAQARTHAMWAITTTGAVNTLQYWG